MSSNFPEFINEFVNNFSIDVSVPNATSRQHPKFSLCGNNFDLVKKIQNQRRLEFLDNLKRKREAIIEKNRLLFEDYFVEDYCETNTNEKVESTNLIEIENKNDGECKMETDSNVTKSTKSKRTLQRIKKRKDFQKLVADKFMLSEWLVDIPEDFYQNWYMLCCPKGKRTLVIASNGRTSVYARNGYFMFYFESQIPGGSRFPLKNNIKTKNSVLDCIFVESEQTFYILDVIIWNGCSFYGCDTEFRFYWMHNNISEEMKKNSRMVKNFIPNTNDVEMSELNEKRLFNYRFDFKSLPYWPCTLDNIKLYSNGPYSFNTGIDGILFYHKEAPYTAGITPLVCWLKVSMIPKIFNIIFHPNNLDKMEK